LAFLRLASIPLCSENFVINKQLSGPTLRACEDAAPLVEWHLSAIKRIPSSLGSAMRLVHCSGWTCTKGRRPHKLFIPAAACIKGAAQMSEPSPSVPKPRSIRCSAVSGGESLRTLGKSSAHFRAVPEWRFITVFVSIHSRTRTKTSVNPSTRCPPPATLMNSLGSLARSNSRLAKFIGMTRSSSP